MKKTSLLLLFAMLLLSFLLTSCSDACDHTDGDGDLVCDTCGDGLSNPDLDGEIVYKITVLGANGEPCPNIIVELYDGEEKIAIKMTDEDGTVKCASDKPVKAGKQPFKVKLVSPDGKKLNYDENNAVISDGKEEITVALYNTADGLPKEPLSVGDSNEPIMAAIMSDGRYRVDLKSGNNYFIFYATSRGQYKISAELIDEASVAIGYFGSPYFVLSENVASADGTGEVFMKDGALFFNIRSFNAGSEYSSSSRYVFRIDASADASAIVDIGCVDKNIPLSNEELPWEDCILPSDPAPYEPLASVGSADELTPVPITDPDFRAVYNPEDGFYHVGAVDGPVIFLKLSVDTEYLASFKTIMETTQFRGYVYDEEGNFVTKKDYHGMMEKYIDAAGELGIYPLTSYLKDALTVIGNAWGWYDGGANSIFTGKLTEPVVRENAYLFACCYDNSLTSD